MASMKQVHLCHLGYHSFFGGVQQGLTSLLPDLAQRFRMTVVDRCLNPRFVAALRANGLNASALLEPQAAWSRGASCAGLVQQALGVIHERRAIPRLARPLSEQGCDVLMVSQTKALMAGVGVSRRCGVPCVYHCHGVGKRRTFVPAPRLVALTHLAKRCRLVIANSQSTKSELTQMGVPGDRIRVVYNGIDTDGVLRAATADRPRDLPNSRGTVLLLPSASLARDKGFDLAIAALAALRTGGLEADLWLTGGAGGDESRIVAVERCAAGLGVRDAVHLLGQRTDIWSVMKAATVVLIPSRVESFGRAAAEAILLGKPVVASAVGGLREVIADGETGWLVPTFDPRVWADTVRSVLQDDRARQRVALHAPGIIISRFGRRRWASDVADVILEAVGGAARSRRNSPLEEWSSPWPL